MTTALVLSSFGPDAPALADDLQAVGIEIIDVTSCTNLLHDVMQTAPDLVICFERSPDPAFFALLDAVRTAAPRPVAVFTTDPDAEKIRLATKSGIHAYVVAGYSQHRLRSVIQLAQARFREERALRDELASIQRQFEERKLVDRAKGILMGARNLREDEAYRALRNAAMRSKQRLGQMSQLVIDTAHYAEAVNRAGRLRMLSQRLVKLYALLCAGVSVRETKALLEKSLAEVDSTMGVLDRALSMPTFGDLLQALATPWSALKSSLEAGIQLGRLAEIDSLGGQLLARSERLTNNLEIAAFATSLHAINVAGRQRMLSQRLAKAAIMHALLPGRRDDIAAEIAGTKTELESGMSFLRGLPLSNAEITGQLAAIEVTWQGMQVAIGEPHSKGGRESIAIRSEEILEQFERLTDTLERAIQMMVG